MNGLHDMGGMHCFGPVVQDADEQHFHHEWERRVFALVVTMGTGGVWNIDASRFVRESLPPEIYLSGGYFRIWLEAFQILLTRGGLLTEKDLAQPGLAHTSVKRSEMPAAVGASIDRPFRKIAADEVEPLFSKGWSAERPLTAAARFAVGDRVRTINQHPAGHTRLPRYARGRAGTINAIHGPHVFPDTNACFAGEQPQWLYSVKFEAGELWGAQTTASCVFLDCWESYLLDGTGTDEAGMSR